MCGELMRETLSSSSCRLYTLKCNLFCNSRHKKRFVEYLICNLLLFSLQHFSMVVSLLSLQFPSPSRATDWLSDLNISFSKIGYIIRLFGRYDDGTKAPANEANWFFTADVECAMGWRNALVTYLLSKDLKPFISSRLDCGSLVRSFVYFKYSNIFLRAVQTQPSYSWSGKNK